MAAAKDRRRSQSTTIHCDRPRSRLSVRRIAASGTGNNHACTGVYNFELSTFRPPDLGRLHLLEERNCACAGIPKGDKTCLKTRFSNHKAEGELGSQSRCSFP